MKHTNGPEKRLGFSGPFSIRSLNKKVVPLPLAWYNKSALPRKRTDTCICGSLQNSGTPLTRWNENRYTVCMETVNSRWMILIVFLAIVVVPGIPTLGILTAISHNRKKKNGRHCVPLERTRRTQKPFQERIIRSMGQPVSLKILKSCDGTVF